eukprot:jgi/Chlat1/8050/Chrsp73S07531
MALETLLNDVALDDNKQCDTAVGGLLAELAATVRACELRPRAWFVAWQGVLTLAFEGFPAPLLELKKALTAESGGQTAAGLPPENPGSMWPKVSLAALKDGARLTPSDLLLLHEICSSHLPSTSSSSSSYAHHVDRLHVTVYACRSHERLLCAAPLELREQRGGWDADSGVGAEERSRVEAVLAEFSNENLPSYWYHASRDGSRELHYRGPAVGSSLVYFLTRLPEGYREFRAAIEAALPGYYAWFDENSLHVTLRALT